MEGYNIKSKAFTEIMENYFLEWKVVRCGRTTRISLNGISIPVKLYYQKKKYHLMIYQMDGERKQVVSN